MSESAQASSEKELSPPRYHYKLDIVFRQNSLSTHRLYSPWSSKNLIYRNQLKKFMQVGIDVTCMHTNFGGCGLSGFGDTTTLKNSQISLSTHGL